MVRARGFRNATVFVCLVAAFALPAGPGFGQTARPSPAASPYTVTVNCPDAGPLVIDITPNTLPAGWTSSHPQLELRVADASAVQGKQFLVCHYKAKDCPGCTGGADALQLKRTVELDSCMNSVPGQPRKSFLCKPGAVK